MTRSETIGAPVCYGIARVRMPVFNSADNDMMLDNWQ